MCIRDSRGRGRFHSPALLAAVALSWTAPGAATQEFHVDTDSPRSVVFISSATLDEFEGVTDRIDGFVLLDGDGVRAATDLPGSRIYFEVHLASLDTGISLRNRHMRENYLEVEAYPYATFDAGVDRIEASGDGGFRVVATGAFTAHGVSRERTLTCGAVPHGDGYRVRCAFSVHLQDHDIEIPRIMFMKLAPEVRLELAFRLRPAPPTDREMPA